MTRLPMIPARFTTLGITGALFLVACQPAPSLPPTSTPSKPAAAASPSPAVSPSPSPSPAASPLAVPSPAVVASPSPSPAAARVVTIETSDYAFNAPDTIAGGLVTLRLSNVGREAHHAQLFRLNPNVTIEQFLAAVAQPDVGPLFQLTSLEGGPSTVDPNGSAEVTVDLREGQYMLVCFVEGPDHIPHVAKGMIRPMRVTAAPAGPPATLPTAAGTATLKDFTFDLPAIAAGRSMLRVVNEGPQGHELSIVRLASGRTAAEVQQFLSALPTAPPAGPPPFSAWVGGMQALSKDGSGVAALELPAGDYAAVCLVPDPGSGRPHTALGMVTGFTAR